MVGYLIKEDEDWAAEPMIVTDSRVLWVGWVDDVGNRTDPLQRRLVDQVEWYATMGNKVNDSSYENPHELAGRTGAFAKQGNPIENAADWVANADNDYGQMAGTGGWHKKTDVSNSLMPLQSKYLTTACVVR